MTNEEAIKDIEENIIPIVGGISLHMAVEALKERKTGQWIPDQLCKHKPSRIRNTDRWTIYHCSCCGHSNGRKFNDRFCPHCGAQMILKTQGGDSDV